VILEEEIHCCRFCKCGVREIFYNKSTNHDILFSWVMWWIRKHFIL